jgi:haloacetate dehalogenase
VTDAAATPVTTVPQMVAADGFRLALRRDDPPRPRRTTPVLALHGVPDDGRTFAGLADVLRSDRVVLRPDLPGLGDSELRGPYDTATVAARLAALVLHATEGLTGDGRVDVVGHDWGGVVGLALAAARPDLVRRLVLVNAPYRELAWHRAPHVPFFALPVLPELAFRLAGPALSRWMVRAAWKQVMPPPAALLSAADGYAAPERAAAMLGYYRAAARHRSANRIGPVAVQRALIVWGAMDPVLTLPVAAAAMRDLQAGTPDTRQITVPGAGHWPHLEAPTAVLPAIADFLRAG